ncbi:hypothetical protein BV283P2_00057 [Phocaeicola phage BV283P2]|nr:hypothetical protein BV283P2_00012 [Phocaeicola phage BV283P2]WAX10608.1 hypothetical protein BV283P2_00057 [Phocaeicola phage BV283P2]WAX10636.1 hypothetical protein BV283P3_00028 [Phocaeicola phage BV283P3]
MIKFVDLCNAFNVHAFIVWEFIHRYGHTKGVTKDKWGRGSVLSSECDKWLDKFSGYLVFQEYSYKQEINKGLYTYRDPERFQREKESETDVHKVYGAKDGLIIRTDNYKNGSKSVKCWDATECVWKYQNVSS